MLNATKFVEVATCPYTLLNRDITLEACNVKEHDVQIVCCAWSWHARLALSSGPRPIELVSYSVSL
jgi:hypothetical protein